MSKRKANIRPDLVGELFTDGTDYFRLIDCESEPSATIRDVREIIEKITKPISEFANLVMMKPVRPIEKPKKPRADKGLKHQHRGELNAKRGLSTNET